MSEFPREDFEDSSQFAFSSSDMSAPAMLQASKWMVQYLKEVNDAMELKARVIQRNKKHLPAPSVARSRKLCTKNRYAKLAACEAGHGHCRTGVHQYALTRHFTSTILVVGLDGVAATVAENLVRSGVRTVLLLDTETKVTKEICNNGLFYRHEAIGMSRLKCVEFVLKNINPDVYVVSDQVEAGKLIPAANVILSRAAMMGHRSSSRSKLNFKDVLVVSADQRYEVKIAINDWALTHQAPLLWGTCDPTPKVQLLKPRSQTVQRTSCLICYNSNCEKSLQEISEDEVQCKSVCGRNACRAHNVVEQALLASLLTTRAVSNFAFRPDGVSLPEVSSFSMMDDSNKEHYNHATPNELCSSMVCKSLNQRSAAGKLEQGASETCLMKRNTICKSQP